MAFGKNILIKFWYRVKIGKSYKVLNMAGGAKISDPEKIDGHFE